MDFRVLFARIAQFVRGRWFPVAVVVAALTIGAGAMASAGFERDAAQIIKVRFGGDSVTTRMVLELEDSTKAQMVSDGSSGQRLVLLLPNLSPGQDLQGQGRGLVERWVVDEARGGARLSLDLADNTVLARRFLLPPADGSGHYRYVIDLKLAQPGTASSAAVRSRPPVAVPVANRPDRLSLKKVIVIDAGHGGRDPGSSSRHALEKNVTLKAAKLLRTRLESTGRYRVVLTRDRDVYVPLERRVQIARDANADLFISLHADSGGGESTRGASVYTLSEKGAGRVKLVLAGNDWPGGREAGRDRVVSQILLDLSQRATKNRSASFAQLVLDRISQVTPLLRRSHRDAGFMVLLAPDVPAVLLEMGFMSNSEDAAALASEAHLSKLSGALERAIDSWFAAEVQVASR
jgi:N-acetylmuramoyl-L-alanine amidase